MDQQRSSLLSPPVTVARTSSLNHIFSSTKRRARSRTITETNLNTMTSVTTSSSKNATATITAKKPLSRQKSISELVSRVKLSLRSNSTGSNSSSPMSKRQQHNIVSYSSKADDYDVLRTIGAGATASVYSAVYKPNQSVIAIKTVNLEEIGLDDSRLEALRKEIQIMTLCRHPHLLEVYQSFVHSSQLYIVTPIMSAGKLVPLNSSK